MSNRTLIEINHDFCGEIKKNHIEFIDDLCDYIRSGPARSKDRLERFGVRLLACRHHSDPFHIEWGGTTITEQ